MKLFKDLKLGTRLGIGFATVLLLMGTIIALATSRLHSIGEISDRIITKDWVKADAAATINATTRSNARRSMELLLAVDKGQVDKIHLTIETNRKKITDALDL